ncbi:MAG: ABC transporter ATP-binding protein [Acidobacteria bacterium]|nr:ABC transporter ATP-binding protein [Acidobacteriota bacterium]
MPNSDSDLSLQDVSIAYGRRSVLQNVTFRVRPGTTYALLGRNGTGKSSLIRSILGQRPQREGQIRLLGKDPWKRRKSLMNEIGVVPETPDAPPRMTVTQLLRFCSRLYTRWSRKETRARLDRFSIPLDIPFGRLSRGQKTQVHLTLALGHHPRLLILDDPTLGLDAVARKALFEELVSEMAEHKPTILITTHDFLGVERLAERVGILHQGRLVMDEEVDALKHGFRKLMFSNKIDPAQLAHELEALQPIAVETSSWGTEAVVAVASTGASGALPAIPATALSVEEIFIAITGQGAQA